MREAVKHRIIGGAVLAAVAVLFLPSFFKDRQQYHVDTQSRIPAKPSITAVDFKEPSAVEVIEPAPPPETMFLPPDDAQTISLPSEPAVTSVSSNAQVAVSSSLASSASSSNQSHVPVVDRLPLNEAGVPNAYILQVVSLSSAEAAERVKNQLTTHGHRAYVRNASTAQKQVYRVFVGPEQDKRALEAAKREIDRLYKVNSLVLPFKP